MMELQDRLTLFREMVLCCHNLYFWVYSDEMTLLESNCPDEELVNSLLTMGDNRSRLLSYAEKHSKPLIMSNSLGLMYVAIPDHGEDRPHKIYILGPFFAADVSEPALEAALERVALAPVVADQVRAFLRALPVVSHSRAFEYTIMLYYCITGERIIVSDLHFMESEALDSRAAPSSPVKSDAHGTYAMEQEMVRMVREGNLDYQKHMSRLAVSGTIGKLSDDPDRQLKNAVLVCIILFSRAAIEGGLAPEISMTLTDHYFQSVESCKSTQELQMLARTMQDDFVMRVHRVRNSKLSRPVQEICDYADLHLEEDLSLRKLAEQLKYSECYLNRKFRKEVGEPFSKYILRRRMDRAADLLRNNALSVKEVSERLHFCSPSYFAEQFKAVYSASPSEWRANLSN